MDNFQKLKLNRGLISAAVEEFAAGRSVTPIAHEMHSGYVLESGTDDPYATLHIFERNDGLTTLQYKVGRNHALSLGLARHISDVCCENLAAPAPSLMDGRAVETRPFSLRRMSGKVWDDLIAYLRDDCKFDLADQAKPECSRFEVRSDADRVFLHRYPNGTFLMQGPTGRIYGTVVTALTALLKDNIAVIEAQLDVYPIVGVTAKGVNDELRQHIPVTCQIVGEEVVGMMATSLALNKIVIDLSDYTAFVFPVLRGLEGYIKVLMSKGTVPLYVQQKTGFGPFFNHGRMINGYAQEIASDALVSAIESSYGLYLRHRNGLFHVDSTPDTSRTIETKAEASALIFDVLREMERSSCTL